MRRLLLASIFASSLLLRTEIGHTETPSENPALDANGRVGADHATHLRVGVDGPCASDEMVNPSGSRRVVAMATAVVPGVVVNGTGHWVNGQTCTARRLLMAEGLGLLGMGVGIPVIALAGAPRYLTTPAIVLSLGSFAFVMAAIGADLYGSSGAARNPGEPARRRPHWETELGVMRVYNPLFDFGWLLTQRAAANLGKARLSAGLDTALDGLHAQYRMGAALRFFGPVPTSSSSDGSYLDLSLLAFEQRFTSMGFVSAGVELLGAGRLDLGRIGPTLRGSFAEVSLGAQLSRTSYRIVGISVDSDLESMLLGRLAFGAYLGSGRSRGSEAKFYYDHRRDDYAAGIKLPGYGNGMVGHVGLAGQYYVTNQFGIGVLLETGSAHVAGLSGLFRAGDQP